MYGDGQIVENAENLLIIHQTGAVDCGVGGITFSVYFVMNDLGRFVDDRLGESQQQLEYECTVAPVLAQFWLVCLFVER